VQRADLRTVGKQRLIERRGLEDLALQWGRGGKQAGVHISKRLRHALPGRALEQRRELEQLQVANHPVRDVQVGVQAQLAETPTDTCDASEHLLAHHLQRRLELAQCRLRSFQHPATGWPMGSTSSGGDPDPRAILLFGPQRHRSEMTH
jgi:hypothetical protein